MRISAGGQQARRVSPCERRIKRGAFSVRKMRGGLAAAASLALAAAGVGAVAVVSSDAAGTISTTVTLAPTDDTYISQAAKTTNFGSATSMTTNGARNKVKRVYLRFAVNGLP